jgi:hypothetical protein
MKIKNWITCVQDEGSGKRSLRRPKLSTTNFSAWKKKKKKKCRVSTVITCSAARGLPVYIIKHPH